MRQRRNSYGVRLDAGDQHRPPHLFLETVMEGPKVKIDVLMGHSECHSWFEAETIPDGQLWLTGMGSRTDFDRNGKVTAYKREPTGVVMCWSAPGYKPAPWWKQVFT